MTPKKKPMFKVGQVVRIIVDYTKGEKYQRITRVFAWPKCKSHPFGYKLLNRDEVNEKYLSALTSKERGGTQ